MLVQKKKTRLTCELYIVLFIRVLFNYFLFRFVYFDKNINTDAKRSGFTGNLGYLDLILTESL
jgi:hypothetical protein